MITENELALARKCLETARKAGAGQARVTLTRNVSDMVETLDGGIDRVSHCLDRSISLALFVDGRYGTFSTNRLEEDGLEAFICEAVRTTRMLAPDPCRRLPDPARTEKGAVGGNELGLYDSAYDSVTPEMRNAKALGASITGRQPEGVVLCSEEGQYSDSESDSIVLDSNGLFCRHTETSFEYAVEVTVEDEHANRYSAFWWEASSMLDGLKTEGCGQKAVSLAMSRINPVTPDSGIYRMVVDTEVAGRLVTPIMDALAGTAIQQHNSFLEDTLGRKIFHEGLTILDDCRTRGAVGCRLFDSEGVASKAAPIIENGVVKEYFINTYVSGKTGMAPTTEDFTRLHLKPWPSGGLDREAILKMCGRGILVTGFIGGNINSSTGDFSYGIEGFVFENGVCVRPVSGMVVTGNIVSLWNGLIAAGQDSRPCQTRIIPTLAFEGVSFSA